MLQCAMTYREQGFSVIPLPPGRKKPPILKWEPYQTSYPSVEELEQWFIRPYNLAVITGMLSRVLVVDVDLPHGFASLEALELPRDIPTVTTPSGGRHYYFQRPLDLDLPFLTHKLLPGIELKGEGAYAVIPPSELTSYIKQGLSVPCSGPYLWEDDFDPRHLREALPELPPALVQCWQAADHRACKRHPDRSGHSSQTYAQKGHSSLMTSSNGFVREGPLGSLGKLGLDALVHAFEVAWRCAHFLGLSKSLDDIGHTFHCPLPGHEECNPSATLCRGRDDPLIFHDWHERSGRKYYLLPEVFYAIITGKVPQKLPRVSLATWRIRLLLAAGVLAPAIVELKPLPHNASRTLRKVYDGFKLLLQCKWLYEPGEPTAFAEHFAAAWSDVGRNQANEATRALLRLGILKPAGRYGTSPRGTAYLPG
jgi:hypothetical protein